MAGRFGFNGETMCEGPGYMLLRAVEGGLNALPLPWASNPTSVEFKNALAAGAREKPVPTGVGVPGVLSPFCTGRKIGRCGVLVETKGFVAFSGSAEVDGCVIFNSSSTCSSHSLMSFAAFSRASADKARTPLPPAVLKPKSTLFGAATDLAV
jgi:hypothetical protein